MVDTLARMSSDEEAARLLGLTDAEVAEAKDAALDRRLTLIRPDLERRIGAKRAERVLRHMSQAERRRQ